MKIKRDQKGFLLIPLLIIILIVISIGAFYLLTYKQIKKTSVYKNGTVETAKRTFYKNGQPTQVFEEKSKRNSDGFLETVVTSNNKKVSHHLYTKDFIFGLTGGILNIQQLKSQVKGKANYLTTGENILKYVSKTPDLAKMITTLNGKKAIVYTIGRKKSASIELVKTVFAQKDDNSIVKIYVDKSTGVLQKVEQISAEGVQPQEIIEYSEGPFLPPITSLSNELPTDQNLPLTQPEDIVSQLPQLSLEDQLKLIEERLRKELESQGDQLPKGPTEPTVLVALKEIAEETKEIKAVSVQPAIMPDGAIYLNPLSIIPTPSGYNSPTMLLSSTVFNQQLRVDSAIKEKEGFDNRQFIKNNVKVRIDGVEIDVNGIGLEPANNNNSPWTVSFSIPKALAPGYHTIEVFMVDSWYLAPNFLVTLPRPDEKVLELELFVDTPPLATKLPDNQGYRVVLKGKNFIKPFTVSLGNTVLDDRAVAINGTEELILTIPANIPPPSSGPAYDVTIMKDSQKVLAPRFLLIL